MTQTENVTHLMQHHFVKLLRIFQQGGGKDDVRFDDFLQVAGKGECPAAC